MSCRIIGQRDFVDGVRRPVLEDQDGRQWVEGYDGEPVYGVWMLPADEPVIVGPAELPASAG